jgi:uncharacterized protein YcnI
MKKLSSIALGIALAAMATPALAHVTLENGMSSWGAYYKAVLRVPHGCDGAATTGLSVEIPEGVISVKPKAMPGWTITTTTGTYAHTYTMHGKPVTEGVKSITWSGGMVPDDRFDEFAFLVKLPEDKEIMMIYFPVTQTCGDVKVEWNEIPKMGEDAHSVEHPAPSLMLMAPHDGMEDMHH